MGAVSIDQFTDLLTLVRALLDEGAVVSEEVLGEELVEVVAWGLLVFVDLQS